MVEPEMAEKTVPATTATTARRPGTCRISRSTPSITFTASPVWNSTSPLSMTSGIGGSGERGARAVPGDDRAAAHGEGVDDPFEHPAHRRRHGAQHDVDADVLALAHQPGRGEQRDEVEHRLRDLVRPFQAGEAGHDAHVA